MLLLRLAAASLLAAPPCLARGTAPTAAEGLARVEGIARSAPTSTLVEVVLCGLDGVAPQLVERNLDALEAPAAAAAPGATAHKVVYHVSAGMPRLPQAAARHVDAARNASEASRRRPWALADVAPVDRLVAADAAAVRTAAAVVYLFRGHPTEQYGYAAPGAAAAAGLRAAGAISQGGGTGGHRYAWVDVAAAPSSCASRHAGDDSPALPLGGDEAALAALTHRLARRLLAPLAAAPGRAAARDGAPAAVPLVAMYDDVPDPRDAAAAGRKKKLPRPRPRPGDPPDDDGRLPLDAAAVAALLHSARPTPRGGGGGSEAVFVDASEYARWLGGGRPAGAAVSLSVRSVAAGMLLDGEAAARRGDGAGGAAVVALEAGREGAAAAVACDGRPLAYGAAAVAAELEEQRHAAAWGAAPPPRGGDDALVPHSELHVVGGVPLLPAGAGGRRGDAADDALRGRAAVLAARDAHLAHLAAALGRRGAAALAPNALELLDTIEVHAKRAASYALNHRLDRARSHVDELERLAAEVLAGGAPPSPGKWRCTNGDGLHEADVRGPSAIADGFAAIVDWGDAAGGGEASSFFADYDIEFTPVMLAWAGAALALLLGCVLWSVCGMVEFE